MLENNQVSFNLSHVRGKRIVIKVSPRSIDYSAPLVVRSEITGKTRTFFFNRVQTEAYGMENEWWDGEETHAIFTDKKETRNLDSYFIDLWWNHEEEWK